MRNGFVREFIEERDFMPSPLEDYGADLDVVFVRLCKLNRYDLDAMKGELI